ncbi:MAG: hypothetical protein ACRDH5_17975 [bacterium]
MEDSTPLTQRLGDAKAQELLRTHNAVVRDSLRAHGGSEIKHTGDGIMASFGSATKALECAISMQKAFAVPNTDVGAQRVAKPDDVPSSGAVARPETLTAKQNAAPLRPDDAPTPDTALRVRHRPQRRRACRRRRPGRASRPLRQRRQPRSADRTPGAGRRRSSSRTSSVSSSPAKASASRIGGSSWRKGSRSRCGCMR